MLKVVIDTNVVISALISPHGNPAKIIDLVKSQVLRVCYSSDILNEYSDVLSRPKFNFGESERNDFINGVKQSGLLIQPSESDIPFIDEDDRYFYDVAYTCGVFLITGNIKHYPPKSFIVTPAEFLTFLPNPLANPIPIC